MKYRSWREGYWGRGVIMHDQDFQQLMTRARSSLGADVFYDAFVHALEVHAAPFTASSFCASGGDVGSYDIREMHTDRRASIEAIKAELLRLLTKH
jgi:hypothetical protein